MADEIPNNQQLHALLQQEPYSRLVRPNAIRGLQSLSNDKKESFMTGARNLWSMISTRPPEDHNHKTAIQKLHSLTVAIAESERKLKAAQGQQQQGQRPQLPQQSQLPQQQQMQAPQQPSQQQQQQQPQVGVNRPPSQPGPPFGAATLSNTQEVPEKYRQQAENIQWLVPNTPQADPSYREEVKKRYAEQLFKYDLHGAQAQSLERQINKHRVQGKELPPAWLQQRQEHINKQNAAKDFIDKVTMQQNQFRAQQQSQQAARNANGGLTNHNVAQQQQAMNQQNVPNNMNARPLPQNNQQQVNQQVNRPSTSGSHAHAPPSAAPSSAQANLPATPQLPQPQQGSFSTPHQPQQAGGNSFANSPQTAVPPSGTQSNRPVPFSHQGAMDAAARSYGNGTVPRPPGAPVQYNSGETMNRADLEKGTSRKGGNMPINKDFKPTAPTPVPMQPSRPTLAGANGGPTGPMGQPAIQQPPKFNLHGSGDPVLESKKLQELARQVCGGGGDGSDAQGLHPEVEESILQLADEFFDNVVSQACKLAKLRGSNTLEIKDIQLVLQRSYNIRIPGYSNDEVRTVRKVQPTASYLQKMNAVQAAKMTKSDA